MISLIILAVTVLAAVIMFVARRGVIFTDSVFSFTKFLPVLVLVAVGLIVSIVNPFVLERVDAGHVGIKVRLTGDDRGVSNYEYRTGWVMYNEWTEMMYEFPTYQQHIEYDDQTVISRGGFSATIKPSFNYSLVPNAVGDMFVNLRLDIKSVEQGWLRTAIVSSVNDVANRWAIDSIFNHREQFEASIITECNKRVEKWFSVSQLRTNIAPPPALQTSIEQKTRAVQEVQVAENQKLVAVAEGLKRMAEARADSATAVIRAKGEAQSNIEKANGEKEVMRLRQLQLTSLYVEYLKMQKWDGKTPTTVLSNGTSTMVTVK